MPLGAKHKLKISKFHRGEMVNYYFFFELLEEAIRFSEKYKENCDIKIYDPTGRILYCDIKVFYDFYA
jgi:hypothetical protein